MSTILQALQKQKLEQAGINSTNTEVAKPLDIKFKLALFISSLIIISLLVIIILLLKPTSSVALLTESPVIEVVEEVVVIKKAPVEQEEIPQTKVASNVQKVSFTLKALPEKSEKIAVIDEPKVIVLANLAEETEEKVIEIKTVKEIKAVEAEIEAEKEIDYSDVSNDLERRFAQAVLMSQEPVQEELTNNELQEDADDDGSNINQMSSGFQYQVRTMSYDAHMYSSAQGQRWIRINGEVLVEGQFNDYGDIQVVEIQPDRTIFRLGVQSFSLEALADWEG